MACCVQNGGLEELYEFLKVFYVKFGIEFYPFLFLYAVHHFLKRVDVGLVFRLHAEYDIAIHLDEAAVAVPSEAGISRLAGESLNHVVVHTQVKHSVHHAWH